LKEEKKVEEKATTHDENEWGISIEGGEDETAP
jgi:hypothetical protein